MIEIPSQLDDCYFILEFKTKVKQFFIVAKIWKKYIYIVYMDIYLRW